MSETNRQIKELKGNLFELQKEVSELVAERENLYRELNNNRKFMSEMISFIKPFSERINIIRQASFTTGCKVDYILEKILSDDLKSASADELEAFMKESEKQVQELQEKMAKEAQAKTSQEVDEATMNEVMEEEIKEKVDGAIQDEVIMEEIKAKAIEDELEVELEPQA